MRGRWAPLPTEGEGPADLQTRTAHHGNMPAPPPPLTPPPPTLLHSLPELTTSNEPSQGGGLGGEPPPPQGSIRMAVHRSRRRVRPPPQTLPPRPK